MDATCAANEKLRPRARRRRMRLAPVAEQDHATTRPRARRRWAAPAAACVVSVMAASRLPLGAMVDAATMATRTDGVTYCWQVGGSVYASALDGSTPVQEGMQNDCALTLSMQLDKSSYYVSEAIQTTWTVTLRSDPNGNFSINKFGVQDLFVTQDRVSQKNYEIVYSRIESCGGGEANCDPVTGHTDLVANVANKPANFSAGGVASFSSDRVAFASAGTIRLVAHLILPGQDPNQQRYDYAIYKTITISERSSLSPVKNESSESQSQSTASVSDKQGLSTEVIGILFVCGMVAVALVAVGFVFIRKNNNQQPAPEPEKGPDGRSRHDATSTDLDDEFAMLSNEERMMQSQVVPRGKTGNTFLSATGRSQPSMLEESRAAAKAKAEAPFPFVGQAGETSYRGRKPDADLASDDHIVDPSNPASMRHHGMYMEMPPPQSVSMQSRATAPQIFYNDIREDEIHESGGRPKDPRAAMASSMNSTMNPYAVSRQPQGDHRSVAERLGGGLPPGEFEGEAISDPAKWQRLSTELTFDDLRQSADLGPALTLDDLLENKQVRKKRPARPIPEDSRR